MSDKRDLRSWVIEALRALGGEGTPAEVCREIWNAHENSLRDSGQLFFTWQYDVRWAAQTLRDDGILQKSSRGSAIPWRLKKDPASLDGPRPGSMD